MNRDVRPCITGYDVATGYEDLNLTVQGLCRVSGGNFKKHLVIIRKNKKNLMLSWEEWLNLTSDL